MSQPLIDPQLAAFEAGDPANFLSDGSQPPVPAVQARTRHMAIELAVAFLVVRGLASRYLIDQSPRLGEVPVVAGQAWRNHAPLWLRLAVPAIKQGYALGKVEGISDAELDSMAAEYATELGKHLNESSAQALAEGFTQQLNGRWSEQLAWHRAAAAYGLDRQQMRSYVGAMLNPGKDESPGVDPVPTAARLLMDKLLLHRAETMGSTEAWRSMESGKAIAWMVRQQNGDLPADAFRQWNSRNPDACEACRALHGQRAALTEPFVHPRTGARLWAPGAHPHCECEALLMVPVAKGWREDQHPRRRGRFVAIAAGVAVAGGLTIASRGRLRHFQVAPTRQALPSPRGSGDTGLLGNHEDLSATRTMHAMDDHQLRALMRQVGQSTTDNEVYQRGLIGTREYTFGLTGLLNADRLPADEASRMLWSFGSAGKDRTDLYHRLMAVADPAHTPDLFRGMHGVEHQVGDIVDLGHASSFSSSARTAHGYTGSTGRAGYHRGIYQIPRGSTPAVPISGGNAEWLAGGKYRVVAKTSPGGTTHFYTLEPVQPLAKARSGDPYNRDGRGQFARSETRTRKPVTFAEPVRDPVVDDILRQVHDPRPSAFGVVKDPFARPFAGPPRDLFAAAKDPFGAVRDPFASPRPAARSLFDQQKRLRPGRRPDRGRLKRVIHHVAVPVRAEGEAPERYQQPYYLPAEEVHSAYKEANGDVIWEPGDVVDFGEISQALRTYRSYFPDGEGQSMYAVRADDPMALLDRDQQWASDAVTDQLWAELLPRLRAAHQEAIAEVDTIVERLAPPDLRTIFLMAGYDDREDPASMRARISRAARGRDGDDDSLAGAYADHLVWTEPELLGDHGAELAQLIEEAVDADIVIHGAEHNQFLAFDNGFHSGVRRAEDRAAMDLDAHYLTSHAVYHSALLEHGAGARPFVVGWREAFMVPCDSAGRRLPAE